MSRSMSATATPGKRCPPVPPQAMATFRAFLADFAEVFMLGANPVTQLVPAPFVASIERNDWRY